MNKYLEIVKDIGMNYWYKMMIAKAKGYKCRKEGNRYADKYEKEGHYLAGQIAVLLEVAEKIRAMEETK
jgi:hypothetical protein